MLYTGRKGKKALGESLGAKGKARNQEKGKGKMKHLYETNKPA